MRLQQLSKKSDIALDYSSLVLFPETFIQRHQVSGRGGRVLLDVSVEFLTEPGQDQGGGGGQVPGGGGHR